jgi:hypothetical protein
VHAIEQHVHVIGHLHEHVHSIKQHVHVIIHVHERVHAIEQHVHVTELKTVAVKYDC